MGVLIFFLYSTFDFRGIWIPRWSIDDNLKVFLNLEGKFNHIFLQVFANGEAYYPSKIAPNRLSKDRWLKDFLNEAHKRNIKVSAWINLFYSWGYAPRPNNRIHPINANPNWYVRDRSLKSITEYSIDELKAIDVEGYFLSPANPDVRNYLIRIIEEILTEYKFDGIHIDYVRYPNRDFVYDISLRKGFYGRYLFDPVYLNVDSMVQRFGIQKIDEIRRDWKRYICDNLGAFIYEIKRKVKGINPNLLFSAAVKPDFRSAQDEYYQDWLTWLNNGFVDLVCLMAYDNKIEDLLIHTSKNVKNPYRVAIGLGIHRLPPERIYKQLLLIESMPFAGFVYFSYTQLKKNQYLEIIEF